MVKRLGRPHLVGDPAMSTTLYHFSGSGNSLHAARELQQRLPDADLVTMVRLLGTDAIRPRGETVGFVFPIHGMTLPIPVRRFISRLDPASTQYLFAVATRAARAAQAERLNEIATAAVAKVMGTSAVPKPTRPLSDELLEQWHSDILETTAGLSSRDEAVREHLESVAAIRLGTSAEGARALVDATYGPRPSEAAAYYRRVQADIEDVYALSGNDGYGKVKAAERVAELKARHAAAWAAARENVGAMLKAERGG